MRSSFHVVFFKWVTLVVFSANALTADDPLSKSTKNNANVDEINVNFQPIRSRDYANFPTGWSAGTLYRLGLIRTPADYAQVFQPAAVAGNQQPYAPPAELYEREMIVVIGRVARATRNPDQTLKIEKVIQKGKTLDVFFSFKDGPKSATYSVKATAAVRIPKQVITQLRFFEATEIVGELKIAEGEWLQPAPESTEE